MATELTIELIDAAQRGDEAAQDAIFTYFDKYVKGWGWREANSGSFAGTLFDADDLANMLRERIWLAMQKFRVERANGKVVQNFIAVCKAYMAAGMWSTRNQGHRAQRMPKQRVAKEFVEKRTRNPISGKISVASVPVESGEVLQSAAWVSIHGLQGPNGSIDADRLIRSLRVEIDFDFEIYLADIRAELAGRDPFLRIIFDMLYEESGIHEIAEVVGTSAARIKELIQSEIQPMLLPI